jgi:hypothetical protein
MVREWVGGIGLDEMRWWMGFEILCNALPFIFFRAAFGPFVSISSYRYHLCVSLPLWHFGWHGARGLAREDMVGIWIWDMVGIEMAWGWGFARE